MGGLCCDSVNSPSIIHSLKTSSKSIKYLSEFPIFLSDVKKSNNCTMDEVHKTMNFTL